MGGAGIIKYVQYDPRVVFGGAESISDCVLARFLETNVDSKKKYSWISRRTTAGAAMSDLNFDFGNTKKI